MGKIKHGLLGNKRKNLRNIKKPKKHNKLLYEVENKAWHIAMT